MFTQTNLILLALDAIMVTGLNHFLGFEFAVLFLGLMIRWDLRKNETKVMG